MKLNLLLALSFLSLFTMSCEQEELVAPKSFSPAEVAVSDAVFSADGRSNLLAEATFEPTLSTTFRKQIFTAYGFAINQDFARSGSNAARFEMRKGDGKIRSEILLSSETQSNRWYGNSLYLPSEAWENDMLPDGWEMLTQWHAMDDAGEPARFPPLALVVSKGRLNFIIYWASRATNTNATIDGKKVFDLGPVEKDKWLDMVYHINFSHQSDGVLEVWKNGKKVIDFKGPNAYNDNQYPYLKVGLYKRGWNNISKRVVYVDDIRVGNGNATYQDVAPAGATTPTIPATPITMDSTTTTPVTDTTATATPATDGTGTPSVTMVINNNAATTTSTQAMLTVNAVNATHMRFYDNSNSTWSAWEAVAATKAWTLSSGAGSKWVKVQVKNAAGKMSVSTSDGILLKTPVVVTDTTPTTTTPTTTTPTTTTTTTTPTTTTTTTPTTTTTTTATATPATDGTGTPSVTMVINNNAATTTSTQAMLTVNAVNATHMRFYDNSNSTWTAWEAVAATKAWTLSSGAGSKWVKVQVKNAAGKMSLSTSDGILLKAL